MSRRAQEEEFLTVLNNVYMKREVSDPREWVGKN